MTKPIEPQQLAKIEQVLGVDATGTRTSRRNLVVYGAIGVALLALLVWFSLSGGSGSSVRYVTEPVVRGDLTVIVTATGSVQPTNHVDISSELSGTVRKVNVDFNSAVKVGQVLAERKEERPMRALVVYYSFTGNTRNVAERVGGDLGADIAEVHSARYESGGLRFLRAAFDSWEGCRPSTSAARFPTSTVSCCSCRRFGPVTPQRRCGLISRRTAAKSNALGSFSHAPAHIPRAHSRGGGARGARTRGYLHSARPRHQRRCRVAASTRNFSDIYQAGQGRLVVLLPETRRGSC